MAGPKRLSGLPPIECNGVPFLSEVESLQFIPREIGPGMEYNKDLDWSEMVTNTRLSPDIGYRKAR